MNIFDLTKINPFELTQSNIDAECRHMDKADVYKWVYEDEKKISQLTNNWNKLEELIDAEKTRLAKACSHTYEDSLGKTKFVNEDIFNELNNILDKMKEIKEKNNER